MMVAVTVAAVPCTTEVGETETMVALGMVGLMMVKAAGAETDAL
jgi:hypothetical protein